MSEFFMFRGVEFDLGYADFHASDHNLGLIKALNTRNRKLSPGMFTYRIINHWEANGLLSSDRKNNTGWRKYSIMDIVWVFIIGELRTFGFSHEQIIKVKKHLTQRKEKPESFFPLLEYYVTLCLYCKPVYLLVFPNGEAHPLSEKEYQLNRELSTSLNYIVIKLNYILQNIFSDQDLKPNFKHDFELSLDERKAVILLRLIKYQEITFTFANGESSTYELGNKEKDIPLEDLVKMVISKKYESITIKHGTGKYFHFKRKVIHKGLQGYQTGLFE